MKNYDYFKFEEKFRGSRKEIIKKLGIYDGLLNHIVEEFSEPSVLDIGCGRGEWLEKCKAFGLRTYGIESNPYMVKNAEAYDLNISCGDGIELLNEISNRKFSIISAFHLIEHLDYNYMIDLLSKCRELLAFKGLLLLETPSIDNLSVSSKLFYTDPTHINPINGDSIVFNLETIGFHKAKFYYINGGPLQKSDNHHLTRIFNGVAQDITILATNHQEGTDKFFLNENTWTKYLYQGINTLEACSDFDLCTNSMKEKITEQELLLRKLGNRCDFLEQRLFVVENPRQKVFLKKILAKSKKIPFSVLLILRKICAKTISFCLKFFMYPKITRFLISSNFGIKLFYFLLRFLKKIGFSHTNKYFNKFDELKRISDSSKRLNNQLLTYFEEESSSQSIYKDLSS